MRGGKNGDHFTLGDICTVTVNAQQVADKDIPLDNLSADYRWQFYIVNSTGSCGDVATPIHIIQGEEKTSSEVGNFHTIEGVVVLNRQGADQLGGFFVQEEEADNDNNPATSEGIFVYDNRVAVNEGDVVRVSGKVAEYFGLTELSRIEAITICSQAANLPTAATITLPIDELELEHYEGMWVILPQTLTINNNYDLGHYGEVTLSYGRLLAPTQVILPGSAANDWQANNNRNQIILDDGSSLFYPELISYPPPELSAFNTFLPYIEMSLYTDIDGQVVASVMGLFSGVLEIPFGFDDFAIKELVFLNTVVQTKSCHARFISEEGKLQIPYIQSTDPNSRFE